jgi:hypothetical protein
MSRTPKAPYRKNGNTGGIKERKERKEKPRIFAKKWYVRSNKITEAFELWPEVRNYDLHSDGADLAQCGTA